jgi:hypothetical protein
VDLGRDVTAAAEVRRPVGRGAHGPLTDGRPVLADAAQTNRILARFERLSTPLGTTITPDGNEGVIRLRPTTA